MLARCLGLGVKVMRLSAVPLCLHAPSTFTLSNAPLLVTGTAGYASKFLHNIFNGQQSSTGWGVAWDAASVQRCLDVLRALCALSSAQQVQQLLHAVIGNAIRHAAYKSAQSLTSDSTSQRTLAGERGVCPLVCSRSTRKLACTLGCSSATH